MLLRTTFALAAGLAIAGSAAAKEVRIGSTTITLPSPEKYCEMTDKEPADARVLKQIGDLVAGTQNELLSVSADCSQLDPWRVAKLPALDDYVQYQTPMSTKDSDMPRAAAVKGFCANLRTEGEKTPDIADLNARMETALKGVKFNETSFLGVLAEDADACYYGLMQKLKTEVGDEKTQVTVAATTVVKGKVVYYNLYTVYGGAGTLGEALSRHQRNIPALLAANGDLSSSGEVARKDDQQGGSHQVARPVPVKETPAKEAAARETPVKEASAKENTAIEQAVNYSTGAGSTKTKGRDGAGHLSRRDWRCLPHSRR